MFRPYLLLLLPLLTQCSSTNPLYLSCSLTNAKGAQASYSFAFDPHKSTLLWVEPSQPFKVTKNTDAELWAEHTMKYRDFSYDQADFRLNRVTGEGRISYLKKPTAQEIEQCNKERGWGCNSFLVLTEHDEAGSCAIVQRRVE